MKFYRLLCIFLVNFIFVTGCGALTFQLETDEKNIFAKREYQILLDKFLSDGEVVNFISTNNCVSAEGFYLCREAGIAFWVDSMQVVKMVWLYSWSADGFSQYHGELPYGISFYDPMWLVIQKMKVFDDESTSMETSMNGLPDVGSSPDHMYYWAEYRRFNIIIIYDCPSADEDAYIYAIVVKSSGT